MEDILHDAQEYTDFGEQWIDIVENTCDPPYRQCQLQPDPQQQSGRYLNENLESITNTILNSNLIQGPGQNGFSNKVRFRANKSFNYDEEDWGTNQNHAV